LERNIYGVDINEESVEIARLSLWLRTATKGRKLNDLSGNIKCGNSLIDDPSVAGAKAFDWKTEFPQVFAKGGFDVVIGNPPYVFGRENFREDEKSFYHRAFETAQYQINTYIIFIEQSNRILKGEGTLGLIVPNSWLMINSAADLREYLLRSCSVQRILNLTGYSFEQANVETIILIALKGRIPASQVQVYLNQGQTFTFSHKRAMSVFEGNPLKEFDIYSNDVANSLVDKLTSGAVALDDIVVIKAGLKAYQTGKGKPKQTQEIVDTRPFDFDHKYNENTHRYLEGKHVARYGVQWSGDYLWYGPHLAEPRIFEGEKVIIREITGKYPRCMIGAYTKDLYLFNLSNIAVLPKAGSDYSLLYLLGLLNSKLMSFFFLNKTAKSVRRLFPKIILSDLRRFPIHVANKKEQEPLIAVVNGMLKHTEQFNQVTTAFTQLLRSKYTLPTLSRNLEQWPGLEFKGFLQELKKAKVTLTLPEEAEWLGYFTAEKAKAQALQAQIAKTDKEIDGMVYRLYGLTEEEVKVVEGKH